MLIIVATNHETNTTSSVLPPISTLDHPSQVQHLTSNMPSHDGPKLLPSIDALISPPERMTPAPSHVAPYHHHHTSPTEVAAQQAPSYSAHHHSSVSPAHQQAQYNHQRYASGTTEPGAYARADYNSYPTPQSPRRMSYPQPSQAWPAQVPQNYVFTAPSAQPYASQGAQAAPHGTYTAPAYAPPPQQYHPDMAHDVKRQRVWDEAAAASPAETFDLETSLNRIADCSKQIFEFAHHYSSRAHQTSRSGPLPGATPNLMELDDMLRHTSDVHGGLMKLREVITAQQAALAERSREQMQKNAANSIMDDHYALDQAHRDGNLNGQDIKKRRGRAAPPGRCHSCNRAETPEWRRGPDGARTLCNACGLRKLFYSHSSPTYH